MGVRVSRVDAAVAISTLVHEIVALTNNILSKRSIGLVEPKLLLRWIDLAQVIERHGERLDALSEQQLLQMQAHLYLASVNGDKRIQDYMIDHVADIACPAFVCAKAMPIECADDFVLKFWRGMREVGRKRAHMRFLCLADVKDPVRAAATVVLSKRLVEAGPELNSFLNEHVDQVDDTVLLQVERDHGVAAMVRVLECLFDVSLKRLEFCLSNLLHGAVRSGDYKKAILFIDLMPRPSTEDATVVKQCFLEYPGNCHAARAYYCMLKKTGMARARDLSGHEMSALLHYIGLEHADALFEYISTVLRDVSTDAMLDAALRELYSMPSDSDHAKTYFNFLNSMLPVLLDDAKYNYTMGVCYMHGIGCEQDTLRAKVFLSGSASMGHVAALELLMLGEPEDDAVDRLVAPGLMSGDDVLPDCRDRKKKSVALKSSSYGSRFRQIHDDLVFYCMLLGASDIRLRFGHMDIYAGGYKYTKAHKMMRPAIEQYVSTHVHASQKMHWQQLLDEMYGFDQSGFESGEVKYPDGYFVKRLSAGRCLCFDLSWLSHRGGHVINVVMFHHGSKLYCMRTNKGDCLPGQKPGIDVFEVGNPDILLSNESFRCWLSGASTKGYILDDHGRVDRTFADDFELKPIGHIQRSGQKGANCALIAVLSRLMSCMLAMHVRANADEAVTLENIQYYYKVLHRHGYYSCRQFLREFSSAKLLDGIRSSVYAGILEHDNAVEILQLLARSCFEKLVTKREMLDAKRAAFMSCMFKFGGDVARYQPLLRLQGLDEEKADVKAGSSTVG